MLSKRLIVSLVGVLSAISWTSTEAHAQGRAARLWEDDECRGDSHAPVGHRQSSRGPQAHRRAEA